MQNGVKLWHNLTEVKKQELELRDGRYLYSIEMVEDIRSREQNNAMWAIPYLYFKAALIEAGILTIDSGKLATHEWCMVNCLPADYRERIYEEWKNTPGIVNIKTGEVYKEPFRLTTKKMSKSWDSPNYYRNMQDCYAENFSSGEPDDFIPDPDPDYKNKIKNESRVKKSEK